VSDLKEVCREFELVLVVLFGSRARGGAGPSSDSDVGVLRREGIVPAARFFELAACIREVTGLPEIDLVDLMSAPPLLQHQVGSHGRPLFEDEPGRFNLFRVKAWKLYLDDVIDFRRLDALYVREGLERLRP
jgi:predicted nucleotidyltransferase